MILLILLALTEGERDFILHLYERYRGLMWRYARSMTRSEDSADEVVQTSFANMMKHAELLSEMEEKPLKAYIRTTVRNTAYSFQAGEARRAADPEELCESAAEPDFSGFLLQKELVRSALEELERLDRDLIILRYGYDLSFEDVARRLNMTRNNAIVRYHRALRKLKTQMAKMVVSS